MPKARLSMAFETLSGSFADGVAVPTRGGTRLRAKPDYRYPVKPAVASGNARLKVATAAYWTMSQEQVDAWTAWGEAHPRTDPVTGATYPSDSRNAFTGLACKCLQVDPAADLPLWPPTGRFVRQRLTIEVASGSLSPDGSFGREGRGERHPEPPSPAPSSTWETTPADARVTVFASSPLADPKPSHLEEGVLTFTASAPTLEGRVVELLVQPLKHVLCKPQRFYKSHGFVAFTEGHLTFALPLPAGAYAVAVQQIEPSTGRTAGFTPLGKVEVV